MFVNGAILYIVLMRLFTGSNIKEVKFYFHLVYLLTVEAFLSIKFVISYKNVFLSLTVKQSSSIFAEGFIDIFELSYFVRAHDDTFELPGCLWIAEIFPFHHVQSIDFHIKI